LTGTTNVGLFYSTTGSAQVRDVRLSGVTLSGGTNTGALVASAASGFNMINVVMDAVTATNTISSNNSYLGALLGTAGTGTLSNIYVLNTNVTGTSFVGGVVGNGSMTVSNVHKVGNVTATGSVVGGAFGAMTGTISNVDSIGNVTVTGNNYSVGGLIGDAGSSNITNAFATGTVAATSSYQVGGLLGVYGSGTLTNVSTSGGNVAGTYRVGGLVGYVTGAGNMTTASTTGNVSGTSEAGGLVGWYGSGTITTSSTTGNVTGSTNVGGLVGRYRRGRHLRRRFGRRDLRVCGRVKSRAAGVQR
jgi:hypothetical protein